MVDSAFVEGYGGDVQEARTSALEIFDAMKNGIGLPGNTGLEETLLSRGPGYAVTFRMINFTTHIAPDSWSVGGDQPWAQNIRNFWAAQPKSCIRRDLIVLLTGQNFGADGFYSSISGDICEPGTGSNSSRVAVVRNKLNNVNETAKTFAHEIMHAFGLGHLDDLKQSDTTFYFATVCHNLCNTTPRPLMCGSGGDMEFTACDDLCIGRFFGSEKCACIAQIFDPFPDDFVCPLPDNVAIAVSTDNPNPVIGCRDKGDEVIFSVSVINNNQAAQRNIRAIINGADSAYAEFVIDTTLPFNCIRPLSLGAREFRITDSLTSGCDVETLHQFDTQEVKTFRFKVRFKGGIPPTINSFRVIIYSGADPSNFVVKVNHDITPCKEITGGNLSTLVANGQWFTYQPLFIKGDLVINNAFVPGQGSNIYDFKTNKKLLFAAGKGLTVANSRTAMTMVEVEGCDNMWKGIRVYGNSAFETNLSTIKDAQNAVSVEKGAKVTLKKTRFLDNNFSVVTHPAGSGNYNIALLGNQFGTTAASLKPAYGGQTPAPLGKGFTGFYLKDAAGIVLDSDTLNYAPNHFFNLKYGIIADNSEFTVRSATFEDIAQVVKGSGYAAYAPGLTGRAIYAQKGGVRVIEGTSGQKITFRNCHTGVETLDATAYVWRTTMTGMTNGIITTNGNYSIHWDNVISATDRGIELRHTSPLGFPVPGTSPTTVGGIYDNDITMTGNANGIAINLAGNKMIASDPAGAPNSPPQFTGGSIASNTITLNNGAAGIQINAARKLSAYDNHVALNGNQDAVRGISLNAGDQNAVSCNTVKAAGAGQYTGLYAIHPDRAKLRCNLADATAAGLRVEGVLMGKNKADIAGNLFQDNATGLLYGMDAISGPQLHRGNRWSGSGTVAEHQGGALIANASKYTVDAAENPEFLPAMRLPQNWFEDISDTLFSYGCPYLPGSCIQAGGLSGETPDQALDEKTARGELPAEYYPDANNWLAQRRLYERILDEGNPYPENTGITGFISTAQSNGLAAYAAVQTGIRQALMVSQADHDSLQQYEIRILETLDSLARLERQLYARGISAQDSANWSDQRAILLQTIHSTVTTKQTLTARLDSLRSVAAGSLLTQNGNLADLGKPYADHEKTVNDILLRTVLHGVFAFSAQDSATLESIAVLCPLSAGEPVLRARAILALAWETPRTFDDEAVCISERSRPETAAKSRPLKIYPNPATDRLTIEYGGDENWEQTFFLFNTLGQVVKIVVLPKEQNMTQVLLNNLPAGIYTYRVSGKQTVTHAGKIVIKH